MLYSYNWLLDYLDEDELKKDGWSAEKVGEKLALTLCEYENKKDIKFSWDGILVGKILQVSKHPNADKLSVTTVEVGKKTLQIVCGASNVAKGMLVPVAIVGTKLGNGMVIGEVELRGVKSHGMICSAEELGLEEKSSGIMDLGTKLKTGMKLDDALNFDDQILEMSITFNRPDCLSMLGMAKEIAVALDTKFYEPKFKFKENSKKKIDGMLEVSIKDPEGCLRYSARVLENVKIKESPLWLKRRLIVSGLRPINAVVDITNYVMLEYGQPMHAFDYDLIIGHKIQVRKAKKGERIMTLDGEKKVLTDKDLIIADDKRPLAIAGIMGGEDSGVLNNTKTIVLESANFARKYINETARIQGLATDSSLRFGKGLPLSLTIKALDRAAYLIQQICGGEIVRGMIDVRSKRILKKSVSVEYDYLNDFLGLEIPKVEVKKILKSLGCEIEKTSEDGLTVIVPEDRIDLECSEDLIEEVARINGYEKIKDQTFKMEVQLPRPEIQRRYRNKIINYLYSRGYSEIYSYSFVSEDEIVGWGFDLDDSFELSNPLDQDLGFLRQSLIAGLVEKYRKWSKVDDKVNLFEWGKVFNKNWKERERNRLAVICGDSKVEVKDIFLQAKSTIEGMFGLGGISWDKFEVKRLKETKEVIDFLHPVNSVVFYDEQQRRVGEMGVIHPGKAMEWKVNKKFVYAEFDLEYLIENFDEMYKYRPFSKFPYSKFDASFIVDKKIMARELIDLAMSVGGEVLRKVEVFDEFEMGSSKLKNQNSKPQFKTQNEGEGGGELRMTNDKLREGEGEISRSKEQVAGGEGKKSLGLRFLLQRDDRTLGDEEVNELMQKIFDKLKSDLGAELRDR